ncbi:hypothetical protein AB9K34_17765 [Sedimentitalea sp. XS_ASV28]|uniref:hypothetical protein n=1 Tax=Sedimentitalea sp. XS_ASV28 TaxID=3241296 RepID=UPI0035173A37
MLILLVFLLIGVAAYFTWRWRSSTVTRQCRWRADRSVAADYYRCLACGGHMRTGTDRAPRVCMARASS